MPTPVFVCGAECGVTGGGNTFGMAVTSANGHWQTMDTGITVDTANFAPGGGARSYKIVSTAQSRQLARTFAAAGNIAVARFKIMFTTLPSTATLIAWFDGGTSLPGIRYNGGNFELYQKSLGTNAVGPAVVAGRWYTIDMQWNTGANPWVGAWRVDGVPYGGISPAVAAATRTGLIFGTDLTATATFYVDDIVCSQTAADYPFGDGVVLGLSPISDGAHAFNANEFKYNNTTAFSQTVTDVFTYLDETIDNVSDYITQAVINAVGYVQVRFKGLPWSLPNGKTIQSINGLAVVGGFHATTSSACTCTLTVVDGTTLQDVFTLLSPGATTIVNYYKVYATSVAASLPWTRGTVNGFRARFGFSTDVTPFPSCDALMLEVDCVPAVSIPIAMQDVILASSEEIAKRPAPVPPWGL